MIHVIKEVVVGCCIGLGFLGIIFMIIAGVGGVWALLNKDQQ